MRAFLIAAILLAAGPAHADAIARNGSDWVRLTLGACADPAVVAVLEAQGQHADAFRSATAHVGGQDFAACWQPAAGGAGLVYSDGDGGFLPVEAIKPIPEA